MATNRWINCIKKIANALFAIMGIGEEIQYGALKIRDDVYVILDAMEIAYIDKVF